MSNIDIEKQRITACHTKPPTSPRAGAAPTVVGIAGGIASGKSTVAAMFAQLGAEVIDADAIARKVLESPEVCESLRRHWGEGAFGPDGRPDRNRIAEIAFRDRARLRELNQWVHPATRLDMKSRLDHAGRCRTAPLVVIDAPLLLEAKLDAWCDHILFVEADPEVRTARTEASRGWHREEITRREAAQTPLDEKRRRSDAFMTNNGSEEETRAQVERLFRQWTQETIPGNGQPTQSGGKKHG